MNRVPPRSAYIHVPFCRHRCGYCNFSVVADRDDLIERFLTAIDDELAGIWETAREAPPILETLFVGGGTPTHLPPAALDRFLTTLAKRFDLSGLTEWTVEANPEDISEETLGVLVAHGVNRISLGVQSFNDEKLQTLQRGHRGDQARRVIETVASRVPNVSIDLIFAAPGESLASWRQDIETACRLPITHISTYALTFEKGTSFWTRRLRGQLVAADEDLELEMYDLARKLFHSHGFEHYEVSNFARNGMSCRHNLAYWRGEDWYAVGPGAASFLDHVRAVNHRSTSTYLKRIESGVSPIAESETISPEQAAREKLAFGVRMIGGVDLGLIHQESGVDVMALCESGIASMKRQGLVEQHGELLRLTERGIHFADTVASEFL